MSINKCLVRPSIRGSSKSEKQSITLVRVCRVLSGSIMKLLDFNRELNSQLLLQELLFYLFFKKNQSLPFILRAFHGRAEPRRLIDFGPTSYQDDSGMVPGTYVGGPKRLARMAGKLERVDLKRLNLYNFRPIIAY